MPKHPQPWTPPTDWTLIADSDVSGKHEFAYLAFGAIIIWVTLDDGIYLENNIDTRTLCERLARWTISDPAIARKLGL